MCRCYTAGGRGGLDGHKSSAELVEEDREAALKELEPLKLPGKLAEYTGNVMYPNEESAVWDVDRECFCLCVSMQSVVLWVHCMQGACIDLFVYFKTVQQ